MKVQFFCGKVCKCAYFFVSLQSVVLDNRKSHNDEGRQQLLHNQ